MKEGREKENKGGKLRGRERESERERERDRERERERERERKQEEGYKNKNILKKLIKFQIVRNKTYFFYFYSIEYSTKLSSSKRSVYASL